MLHMSFNLIQHNLEHGHLDRLMVSRESFVGMWKNLLNVYQVVMSRQFSLLWTVNSLVLCGIIHLN